MLMSTSAVERLLHICGPLVAIKKIRNMLTDNQIVNGIKKTIENAKSLLEDASFLFQNGRNSRAYTLYQLSIEEAGKSLILYNSLLRFYQGETIDDKHLRKFGYLDHKSKTKESLKLELTALLMFKNNGNDITELLTNLTEEEKIIGLRNDKKNESLYVTLKGINFISPEEVIHKKEVEDIGQIALIRVKVAETYSLESIKDLDKVKYIANEIQKIENDPKLENEFRQKLDKWIND